MPPPKKPKNGPTSVEQFLSREELELQRMEEAPSEVAPSDHSPAQGSCSPPSTQTETLEGGGGGRVDGGGGGGSVGGGDSGKEEGEEEKNLSPTSSSSSASGPLARVESSAFPGAFSSSSSSMGLAVLGTAGGKAFDSSDPSAKHFRLLRQLFVQQEPDVHGHHHLLPPTSLPAALHPQPRAPFAKNRNGDRTPFLSDHDKGSGSHEQWPLDRHGGGLLTSGAVDREPPASFQSARCSGGRAGSGGSSSSNLQGVEPIMSSKSLMERTYLTSLIKESPPASSGAMAASYLERAALNSGKLLHGLMGAPAAPKYIHAAFQLPLMDTSTSGHAVAGPVSTSVLAYLAAQGTHHHHHPRSPLPPLPPLPRCCGPSSLPLVEASTSALTSFSSSMSSSLSSSSSSSATTSTSFPSTFSSGGVSVPAAVAAPLHLNEPFDLSVKKLSGMGGSLDSDSAGSDKTSGDPSSSSRPGSSTGDLAAPGGVPTTSLHISTNNNNNSTSTSPAVASTPPIRGEINGSSSPALPRGITPAHYVMDLRGAGLSASSPLSKFAHEVAGAVLGTTSALTHRPFHGAGRAGANDNRLSPHREPSDSKASCGDISQGHSRLASGATPGPTGASPGGGGGAGPGPGPGVGGVLGMPSHSIMSSSGHLQAPTSTTPESSGMGLAPNFFPMEPPLSVSDIKQEIPAGSSTPAKLCQVCNDNASGFHYGVWSCEGCKAFFKRSIQGPVDYMCPATNNCTIDKHRRKSCQACRLRKCYEVGMNKGSQRKDRKTSGSTSTPKGKRCRADSTDAVNSTNGGGASKSAKRSQTGPILEALQKADLPVLESYHNHDLPVSRVHLLNTLIKLADRELVYLINWAKHVPGYTDLSLSDQVHLIECCWMELLLLNCAFRSMDYDGRRLVFAPDFHLDRQLWVLMGMTEILEQVSAVTEQMVQFAVTKEELLLLKATILVNAEVRRLASSNKIVEMRQMIVDALTEVAQKSHPEDARRVPTLLLLLTHVRQAGERGIAYFQTLKHGGCVAFCDLLTEMLDAHNSSTPGAVAAASTAVTASLPSTSSAGVDQKTLSLAPPHLPQGPS